VVSGATGWRDVVSDRVPFAVRFGGDAAEATPRARRKGVA
jgi:hypothetical protein